jgi:hypothetical protein
MKLMKTLAAAALIVLAMAAHAEPSQMGCQDLAHFTEISVGNRDHGVELSVYRARVQEWADQHADQVTPTETAQVIEILEFVYLNPGYGPEDLSAYVFDRCMNH